MASRVYDLINRRVESGKRLHTDFGELRYTITADKMTKGVSINRTHELYSEDKRVPSSITSKQ